MKKINYWLAFYIIFSLVFISCSKNDDEPVITTELNNPINKFVWKGMNSWYNWQPNVANLADTKDNDTDAFYTYLNGFSDPEDLFESLLYNKGNTDRFSWIVDDYVELNNSFQGISKSFGFRLQAVKINNNGDIIFYVRYVSPESPAANAGIKRGDIFNAIDGVVVNEANYSTTAGKLSNETVTLTMVNENGGVLNPIEDKTITSVVLAENPIHFSKVFNDINGKKVGYLVYNGFKSSYNDELNAVFATFKAEGIDELILDLRLNGGGSVATSAYLASMISQSAGSDIFAELKFNDKHTNQNGAYTFQNTQKNYDSSGEEIGTEAINRLNNINQLYVLTSGSTASASEMIINGLRPFMPVKVIGTTTYGKNVGSVTLYDSPSSNYLNESSANPSHLYAMQPIVFQIYNKLGQSDYIQGFAPDIEVVEYNYWNNILPFGDENEVVLKAALDDIKGISSRMTPSKSIDFVDVVELDISVMENKFSKEMYIDGTFFK
ncbi:S41 family peptidase [Lutibacter aestuarii]|uniref:S41 family peptidase n=2 Tax=Lutibacter TaxID=358023 RepID=A0ABW2Z714_9FLAO